MTDMFITGNQDVQNSANTNAPDWDRLAHLSRLCLGSTSTKEFAERTGLSRSFISAITNNKLRGKPTIRSLSRMTSPEAKPQNGVTFEQLLDAAGYTGVEQKSNESPKADDQKHRSYLDSLRSYYTADADTKSAARAFINYLFDRGMLPDFQSEEKEGVVLIRDAESLKILISAFAPDTDKTSKAAAAAVLKLVETKAKCKEAGAAIYVMTDNEGVASYLQSVFREEDITVLLTRDYKSVEALSTLPSNPSKC